MKFLRFSPLSKQCAVFIFFLTLSLIAYTHSLNKEFVLDDEALIVNNAYIKSFKFIPHIFTTEFFHFSSSGTGSYYRPFVSLAYMADYALWKLNPFGFRLSNIFLHAINCYLVFILLLRIGCRSRLAFISSTLFALHPIHTNVIIFAKCCLLYTCFILLGALAFHRYLTTKKLRHYLVSLALFVCALLTRENAVVMPLFLLALCAAAGFRKKETFLAIAGFFIIAGFYLLLRFSSPEEKHLLFPADIFFTLPFITANFVNILRETFSIILFPTFFYTNRTTPFIHALSTSHGIFLVCIAAFGIIVLLSEAKKSKRIVSFGLLWFTFGILPLARLFSLHPRYGGAAMFEHWLYTASIGIFVIIGAAVDRYKKVSTIAFPLLACLYLSLTIINNMTWNDNITLYQYSLRFAPRNTLFRFNLAHAYFEKGNYDAALREIKTIQTIEPASWDALLLLGNICYKNNDFEQAKATYEKTLLLHPGCFQAYNNLGLIYERKQKPDKAHELFLKALEINPEYWVSYLNIGNLFFRHRLYAEAAASYTRARELNPDDPAIASLLERAQAAMKKK